MSRLDARLRYRLAGHPGAWRYVGQATFTDDDGRTVEHSWVRMVRVGTGEEEWVDPGTVEQLPVRVVQPGDVA